MTQLQKIFSKFKGHDQLRPVFHNPVEHNGYVYATDTYVLIRVKKSDCDFEIPNTKENIPNFDNVVPEQNLNIKLPIDLSFFDKYKTEDELEYYGEDVKCKECGGDGEVEWEYERWTRFFDCPKCDGDGLESEKQIRKTGNKTYSDVNVKVGEAFFNIHKFKYLLEVQKELCGDITITHLTDKQSMFKIGLCDVLIMPIRIHNQEDYELIEIKI